VTKKYQERDPLDEIRLAFKLFVGDDVSGKISVRSLRRVARELNEQITEEELKSMIEEFDFDQDGMSLLKSIRRGVHKNNDWRSIRLSNLNACIGLNYLMIWPSGLRR
jgi:Ca2+-binding EF-hand superfamily protein